MGKFGMEMCSNSKLTKTVNEGAIDVIRYHKKREFVVTFGPQFPLSQHKNRNTLGDGWECMLDLLFYFIEYLKKKTWLLQNENKLSDTVYYGLGFRILWMGG